MKHVVYKRELLQETCWCLQGFFNHEDLLCFFYNDIFLSYQLNRNHVYDVIYVFYVCFFMFVFRPHLLVTSSNPKVTSSAWGWF